MRDFIKKLFLIYCICVVASQFNVVATKTPQNVLNVIGNSKNSNNNNRLDEFVVDKDLVEVKKVNLFAVDGNLSKLNECSKNQSCIVCGNRPKAINKVTNKNGESTYVCDNCLEDGEFIKCNNDCCKNLINRFACVTNNGYCDDCAEYLYNYEYCEASNRCIKCLKQIIPYGIGRGLLCEKCVEKDEKEIKEFLITCDNQYGIKKEKFYNIKEKEIYSNRIKCATCKLKPYKINFVYGVNEYVCDDCLYQDEIMRCKKCKRVNYISLLTYFCNNGLCNVCAGKSAVKMGVCNRCLKVIKCSDCELCMECKKSYKDFINKSDGELWSKIENNEFLINELISYRGGKVGKNVDVDNFKRSREQAKMLNISELPSKKSISNFVLYGDECDDEIIYESDLNE